MQLDGYKVLVDDVFVSQPLLEADGHFTSHSHCIDAVLHGDNAHEGNIFRHNARQPDALDQFKRAATETFGQEGCTRLLDLYALSDHLTPTELEHRLHQFPEDVRFYLPSNELQRAWPSSAFYHLSAVSPFSTSPWPGQSFHTLDLLYVSTSGQLLRIMAQTNRYLAILMITY